MKIADSFFVLVTIPSWAKIISGILLGLFFYMGRDPSIPVISAMYTLGVFSIIATALYLIFF